MAYDAVVVGGGPNGLAAAVTLARAGRSVRLLEAAETLGGGCRSQALTEPGFLHDVCAAVHPMGSVSPLFRSLPLAEHGLEWVYPEVPLAHPFDDGGAALLEHSLDAMQASLGPDGASWRGLFGPLAGAADDVFADLLGPPPLLPRHPLLLARFGLSAVRSVLGLARSRFRGREARALLGGCAAHVSLPLERPLTAAFGIMLALPAHVTGWPIARGGSQRIVDALASLLRSLGGTVETGRRVRAVAELPPARAVLFDLGPHQLARIAGDALPRGYRRQLEAYRYGPAAFKLDWALDGPIPWRDPACARAGTVHLGGTLEEIAASEAAVWRGEHPERPFVLLSQPTLFDPGRAPAGRHVAWAYCHVPPRSERDMSAAIEAQVERFAPGFQDRILARSAIGPRRYEEYDENYVGGDFSGGVSDLGQLFTRPVARWPPYTTPNPSLYLCSSSTPPGGGVHGMCGFHAARCALRRSFGQRV